MHKDGFLEDLLSRMTLEEKAGQLNLLTYTMDATGIKDSADLEEKIRTGHCGAVFNVFTPAATRALQEAALASRLAVPLIFGYDVIHGHRTIFPIPLGLACSWNLDLIERCARAAAAEAAADGLHWVYSPMVDISQDPRWGRVAEGSGEDPWLGSKIAQAMVRGYQGDDLAALASVLACVKHFALYGAPVGGRDYHTVDMSRRAMAETYFPPYQAAIEAGARTVMTSFNEIDGIPASGNRWLLTELLRKQWGFKGWIVTDYTAVSEMKNHGTAGSDAEAAWHALEAGVDMDMVSELFVTELPNLVKEGKISERLMDEAVLRILETKWDLGLFENAFARCDEGRAREVNHCEAHHRLAREAGREAVVLLKNEGLLPLSKETKISVVGPLAHRGRDMLGCWIAAGDTGISVQEGVSECVDLVEDPEQADLIILVLGEDWEMHGEAASRTSIRLPKAQRKLAKEILEMGKPCLLVTLSGRPLDLSWESEQFPAILHAWALGSEGGRSLADLIFGMASPVGKLTMGFPRNVGQLPMTYREKPGGRPFDPNQKYTSKYLDVENDALYPFGYGLTYGKLHQERIWLDRPSLMAGESLTLHVELHNHETMPVTETVQWYLRDLVASVSRPVKELRGYERVTLDAGEKRVVSFQIHDSDLSFPGRDLQQRIEDGEFSAMVGMNSRDVQEIRFTRHS
jgi:beta-glucosidase